MPLEILEKIRNDDEKHGKSTEIIDKAINKRKKMDAYIKSSKDKEKREQDRIMKEQKSYKRVLFFELLSGIFEGIGNLGNTTKKSDTDYLMPWEQDLVNKGEYESYNFEEEDMDEDDYYYEDD